MPVAVQIIINPQRACGMRMRFNNIRLVVQKLRRESAHARPFGGDFELKILRMRGFSSQFLDNKPKTPVTIILHYYLLIVIAVILRVCLCVCVPHSLALKQQHCFDVRDGHQREAGKSTIGLNVADF